jgi:hypothetical protein
MAICNGFNSTSKQRERPPRALKATTATTPSALKSAENQENRSGFWIQFSEMLQTRMIAAIVVIAAVAQISTGVRSAFRSAHPVHMASETSFAR